MLFAELAWSCLFRYIMGSPGEQLSSYLAGRHGTQMAAGRGSVVTSGGRGALASCSRLIARFCAAASRRGRKRPPLTVVVTPSPASGTHIIEHVIRR